MRHTSVVSPPRTIRIKPGWKKSHPSACPHPFAHLLPNLLCTNVSRLWNDASQAGFGSSASDAFYLAAVLTVDTRDEPLAFLIRRFFVTLHMIDVLPQQSEHCALTLCRQRIKRAEASHLLSAHVKA